MDPVVQSALITSAGLVLVALIGLAQVITLRKINHNTNSMTERLEKLNLDAGRAEGKQRAEEVAATAAQNVEAGRKQAATEGAERLEVPAGVKVLELKTEAPEAPK